MCTHLASVTVQWKTSIVAVQSRICSVYQRRPQVNGHIGSCQNCFNSYQDGEDVWFSDQWQRQAEVYERDHAKRDDRPHLNVNNGVSFLDALVAFRNTTYRTCKGCKGG